MIQMRPGSGRIPFWGTGAGRAEGAVLPRAIPCPPSGLTSAAAVRPVGYGAMGMPTVVALVLAGLAVIATAVRNWRPG
jgi:hypothetical protein